MFARDGGLKLKDVLFFTYRKNITVTSNLYVWKYPSCKQVEEFTFKLDYRTSISSSFMLIRGSIMVELRIRLYFNAG